MMECLAGKTIFIDPPVGQCHPNVLEVVPPQLILDLLVLQIVFTHGEKRPHRRHVVCEWLCARDMNRLAAHACKFDRQGIGYMRLIDRSPIMIRQ